MPGTSPDFWQRTLNTASSSVDWCEPNYVHSPFIAEMTNSLSSLPLVALGLYGAYGAQRQQLPWRIVVVFLTLSLVGVGSIAFHATMLRAAQALDELPMIYAALAVVYCLRFRDSPETVGDAAQRLMARWKRALIGCAAGFTLSYFVLSDPFALFIVTFGVLTTLLTVWVIHFAYSRESPRLYRRFFWFSGGAMVLGFFLFWLPEHVLLNCHHPLQSLHLHSVFHLLSTMSGYSCALWLGYHQLLVSQRGPALESKLLIPRLGSERPPPSSELAVEMPVP